MHIEKSSDKHGFSALVGPALIVAAIFVALNLITMVI